MRTKNAGREAKPVYIYNDKGEYVRKFDSSADFSRYYDMSKNIMTAHRDDVIYKVHDTAYSSYERVGKSAIKLFIKKSASPYIRKNAVQSTYEEFPIDCYNLDNEIIATFKSQYHMRALLGVAHKISRPDTPFIHGDLKFVRRTS